MLLDTLLLVFVALALVAAVLGLFATRRAEPIYMGISALASAAALVTVLVGAAMGAVVP